MESVTMGDHEDLPTNSIEDADPQDRDVGGRSYGCIFCKHGFSTAQALGGHMNIHRKDRTKSRPNLLSGDNSNKQEDNSLYAYPRFYAPVFTSFPQTCISTTPNHHHTTYLPSTSSISQLINHGNDNQDVDVDGVITGPSREEKIMTLGLHFGWSGEDNKESKRRIGSGSGSRSEENELDLELRLGHDP